MIQTILNRQADPVVLAAQLSFGEQAAMGLLSGVAADTKFGRNSLINASPSTTPEAIWGGGGVYTGQPTGSPETVDVYSSDTADDDTTGTGAWTLRFFGLKTSTSTDYESEDIILDGTTKVTSASTWYRVVRAYILTAGSGGENAGAITIQHTTTTANVFLVMAAGINQSQLACTTIPYGSTALIKRIRASIARASGSAGSASLTFRARESGGVYRSIRIFELTTETSLQYVEESGLVVPGGTDLQFVVESVSDNATIAEASFEFYRIED